jgi:hypothetical protein
MALIGDTGNGATLTFATSSLSLAITQIQIGEQTIDMLDVSTLATTSDQEMTASDLKKTQEVTGTAIYVGSATLPVVGATAETMTVTLPLFTGTTTAANLAGTAQFTSSKLPDISNGNIMMYQFKFKFNGDTGPTYTKAT